MRLNAVCLAVIRLKAVCLIVIRLNTVCVSFVRMKAEYSMVRLINQIDFRKSDWFICVYIFVRFKVVCFSIVRFKAVWVLFILDWGLYVIRLKAVCLTANAYGHSGISVWQLRI